MCMCIYVVIAIKNLQCNFRFYPFFSVHMHLHSVGSLTLWTGNEWITLPLASINSLNLYEEPLHLFIECVIMCAYGACARGQGLVTIKSISRSLLLIIRTICVTTINFGAIRKNHANGLGWEEWRDGCNAMGQIATELMNLFSARISHIQRQALALGSVSGNRSIYVCQLSPFEMSKVLL